MGAGEYMFPVCSFQFYYKPKTTLKIWTPYEKLKQTKNNPYKSGMAINSQEKKKIHGPDTL